MIEPLSKVLDADMLELLSYLNDTTITNPDNPETKTNKYRLIFIISLVILLILNSSILIAFTIIKVNAKRKDDNNEVKVYEIKSEDTNITITGYIMFNNNDSIIMINKISYQGMERGLENKIEANNIKVYLKIADSTIFTYESEKDYNKKLNIDELLKNINFDNQDYYNTDLNLQDLEHLFSNTILKIECYEKEELIYENEAEIHLLNHFI